MTQQQNEEKTKSMIMTAAGIGLLLFVAISLVAHFRNQSSLEKSIIPTPIQKKVAKEKIDPSRIPKSPPVKVGAWSMLGAASIAGKAPDSVTIYPFKTNLGKDEALRLSAQLGLNPQTTEETSTRVLLTSKNGNESALFYLHKASGAFMYKATDGFGQTASTAQLEPQRIQQLAADVSGDPRVKLGATYAKTSMPQVKFYEFHRDWATSGLPIVNFSGLFNVPELVKIGDLKARPENGTIVKYLAIDQDVVETSDKADGRVRQNDFNTLTIGVKNGRVIQIVSKLRLLGTNASSAPVITYVEAVKKLEASKYTYIATSPAGSEELEYSDLYPKNTAELRSVTVSDSALVYLEELPLVSQKQMIPYYVFKGYGVLGSGHRVKVLAAVAATSASAATAPQPFVNPPAPKAGKIFTAKCTVPPRLDSLSNVQTDHAGSIIGLLSVRADAGESAKFDWYTIPGSVLDVQQASDVIDSVKRGDLGTILKDYESLGGFGCATRMSGI